MSYGIKIQNICDHKIHWERSFLEDDLKTINLNHPVGSVSSFSLRINNVIVDKSSYIVTSQTGTLVAVPSSKVEMKKKIKLYEPLIESKYVCVQNFCPKCVGIRTIDDIQYTTSGDWATIDKEFLLVQQVEKVIITKIASNSFHDWYGTDLHSLVGTKVLDLDLIRSKIIENISAAVNRLKNVQRQMVASGREIDPGELFDEIISIDLEETDDPTIILVTLVFTAQSGNPLEYSQYLELSNLRERVAFT